MSDPSKKVYARREAHADRGTRGPRLIAAAVIAACSSMAGGVLAQQPPATAGPGLAQQDGSSSLGPDATTQNGDNGAAAALPAPLDRLTGIPGYTRPTSNAPVPQLLVVPSVTTVFTATTNAPLVAGHHDDDVVTVSPSLNINYTSARLFVTGLFALDGTAYLRDTEPDRVLPHGALNLNADVYDHFLFFDAGLSSTEISENPFQGQNLGNSTSNLVSTTQTRVSPYISREIAPDVLLLARSDNTYTHSSVQSGDFADSSGYLGNQSIKVEARPLPLGWGAEVGYSDDKFVNEPQASLRDASARGTVDYSLQGEGLVGLIAGYESVDILSTHLSHDIVGLLGEWRPSALTNFEARAEHRYFGTGWDVRFNNHGPLDAFTFNWSRAPTTYQEALSSAPVGGNLAGLLSQILAPQVTDPGQRSEAVQSILQASGFPQSLPGSQVAYTEQPLLIDSAYASALLLGKFNSFTATVYRSRSSNLLPAESVVTTGGIPLSLINNVQYGATLDLAHTLSPTSTIDGSITRADTEGLGAESGQRTRQTALVIRLTERLSRRTSIFFGLRRQLIDTAAPPTVTESAAFVGLTQGF